MPRMKTHFLYRGYEVEIRKVTNADSGHHYFDTYINGDVHKTHSLFARDAKVNVQDFLDCCELFLERSKERIKRDPQ
jgi:hypothetical protein